MLAKYHKSHFTIFSGEESNTLQNYATFINWYIYLIIQVHNTNIAIVRIEKKKKKVCLVQKAINIKLIIFGLKDSLVLSNRYMDNVHF